MENELIDYILNSAELSGEQKESWMTYHHLMGPRDQRELLGHFRSEPGTLLLMTENIEEKVRALRGADTDAIVNILERERNTVLQP